MKIIVGLGNPGQRYKNTRHNVGFHAVDCLIDRWQATGPNKKNQGNIYNASFQNEKVIIVKPETFMNLSGLCVGPLFAFYKLAVEDIVVIHDDIDLQFSTLRIKIGGGTGGHNGLKSIDEHIGDENNGYNRVRIGIGRPEDDRVQTASWVLQQFSEKELESLNPVIEDVADAVELITQGKTDEAMNRFNGKGT
ncbi:MAG: aminoacyl-tRNA hydrolase [Candidatus Anammoxibacter sp.]